MCVCASSSMADGDVVVLAVSFTMQSPGLEEVTTQWRSYFYLLEHHSASLLYTFSGMVLRSVQK